MRKIFSFDFDAENELREELVLLKKENQKLQFQLVGLQREVKIILAMARKEEIKDGWYTVSVRSCASNDVGYHVHYSVPIIGGVKLKMEEVDRFKLNWTPLPSFTDGQQMPVR